MPKNRKLRKLLGENDFSSALKLLHDSETLQQLTPRDLLLKGRILQLADGGESNLEEAEAALASALEMDEHNIEAMIELGYFYYAVADDTKKAKRLFDRAISLSREMLGDAVLGKGKCLAELSSPVAAVRFLRRLRHSFQTLGSELEEWLEDAE